MASTTFDIVTIGGGIGGSVLAKAMAERGASVLVLESETRFRDRVRGEFLAPWGVAEAKELGIHDVIMASGGHLLRWADRFQGPNRVEHRDLVATTVPRQPSVAFYHPQIQEALIDAAATAVQRFGEERESNRCGLKAHQW